MSFGESLFLQDYFRKLPKRTYTSHELLEFHRGNCVFGLRKVLEDTRTKRRPSRGSRGPGGQAHGQAATPLHILLWSSGVFPRWHQGSIQALPQVSLIQRTMFLPPGYKYRGRPPPWGIPVHNSYPQLGLDEGSLEWIYLIELAIKRRLVLHRI
jgi:hypothetical protein